MYKFFTFALFTAITTGSAFGQRQQVSSYTNTEIVNIPQTFQGAMVTPMLCDYQMLTKESVETTFTPKIKLQGMPTDKKDFDEWVKEFTFEAQAQLIKEHKADAIVGLSRIMSTEADGTIKVIVRGFPVKYVNFRNATEKDLWMTQFYNYINPNLQKVDLGNFTIEQEKR